MNESDIERKLQQQSLAQPSANLNQRMESLFHKARFERAHPLLRTIPVWLMAAACLVCAVAGFGVRSLFLPHQSPPTTIYVFPASEAMVHFLEGAKVKRNDGFDFSHARVQVTDRHVSTGSEL